MLPEIAMIIEPFQHGSDRRAGAALHAAADVLRRSRERDRASHGAFPKWPRTIVWPCPSCTDPRECSACRTLARAN